MIQQQLSSRFHESNLQLVRQIKQARDRFMKFKTFIIALGLAMALFLFAQRRVPLAPESVFSGAIDLTHSISDKDPNWEGTAKSPFEAHQMGRLEKDGYFSRNISLPEHFATHIDAPAHFAKGSWTVDQIPPDRLIGPLVLIDIASKCKTSPDYLLSMEDVAAWEQAHGQMPPGAIVMARTGWAARWNSMSDYRGTPGPGGTMHFPGFSLDAVKFLVESRRIFGLGIDTLGVDNGPSKDFPVHRYTAAHNVYHLENVDDLSAVPASGAILIASPAKLEGGSGGPVRIFALLK
jgi:kynurenine formamidase